MPINVDHYQFPHCERSSDNEDDKDVDPPNTFHEWPEEQERHLEIVDYDAIDLIELSEHFS